MLASEAFAKHKILPSTLHSMLLNRWVIPDSYLDILEKYYLITWNRYHFHDQLENGIIEHQGTRYLVVYHECKPADFLRERHEVWLSFRKAIDDFEIPAYVLVKKGRQYGA